VTVSQDAEKPTHWTATAKYGVSTWQGGVSGGGDNSNPLDQIPVPVWTSERYEVPMDEDVEGDTIVNSAGDRYSPPQMQFVYRQTLIYERNEADFSQALANVFRNTVNVATWNGIPAKEIACTNITGTPMFHPIIGIYYKVKYEFELWDGGITGPDAATRKVLDAGWNEVVGGERVPIINKDLSVPGDVPLLDGAGGRLSTSGTPVYRLVEHRFTEDFSLLNITLL
jgi:hypothetical protein